MVKDDVVGETENGCCGYERSEPRRPAIGHICLDSSWLCLAVLGYCVPSVTGGTRMVGL